MTVIIIIIIRRRKRRKRNIKIFQKIPEQHTGETRHQVTTYSSHIVYSTRTSESTKCKITERLSWEVPLHVP
jgi:hypothetical protein